MLHYCNPEPPSSLFTDPELNWKICTWQMNKDLHREGGSLSGLWLVVMHQYPGPLIGRASQGEVGRLLCVIPLITQVLVTSYLLSLAFISTPHCVTRMLAKSFLPSRAFYIKSTLKGREKSNHLQCLSERWWKINTFCVGQRHPKSWQWIILAAETFFNVPHKQLSTARWRR